LLTVQGTIQRMRCQARLASGTVLWSYLLPASKKAGARTTGSGQGGGVQQRLPLRHDGRHFVVGAQS
jgi:hypothetical protein